MLDRRLLGTRMTGSFSQKDRARHFRYLAKIAEMIFVEKEQILDYIMIKTNLLFRNNDRNQCFKSRRFKFLTVDYRIDPEVVSRLVERRKILYSALYANLYDLPGDTGFDIVNHKVDYNGSKNNEDMLAHTKILQFN